MKKFFKGLLVLIMAAALACGVIYVYNRFIGNQDFVLDGIDGDGSEISGDDLDSLEDSGITGTDYSFDETYYPYYGFLDSAEKAVYAQICANVEAMCTTFVPAEDCTAEEACDAVEAVFLDHPEYFWLETGYSYKYTETGECVQIIMWFSDLADDIDSAKQAFDAAANAIIDAAASLETDYDREKYVHDAILSLASYDDSSDYNQSAYSALVTGPTVCAGYARAFQYIMTQLGIPAYYCSGYSGGDHAWNIVCLDNGYYNVDLTWDDSDPVSYLYFNRTDSDFASTHTRSDISSQLPSCTATEYGGLESSGGPGAYPGSDGITEAPSAGGSDDTPDTSDDSEDDDEDSDTPSGPSLPDTDSGSVTLPSAPDTDSDTQPSFPDSSPDPGSGSLPNNF